MKISSKLGQTSRKSRICLQLLPSLSSTLTRIHSLSQSMLSGVTQREWWSTQEESERRAERSASVSLSTTLSRELQAAQSRTLKPSFHASASDNPKPCMLTASKRVPFLKGRCQVLHPLIFLIVVQCPRNLSHFIETCAYKYCSHRPMEYEGSQGSQRDCHKPHGDYYGVTVEECVSTAGKHSVDHHRVIAGTDYI